MWVSCWFIIRFLRLKLHIVCISDMLCTTCRGLSVFWYIFIIRQYTGCFKKSFTTISIRGKPRIVMVVKLFLKHPVYIYISVRYICTYFVGTNGAAVNCTSWPVLPQRNKSLCPLNRRLGGRQSLSGHSGGTKITWAYRESNSGSSSK
jgi:hypothetical protein